MWIKADQLDEAYRFQFQVDGVGLEPIRETWKEAAEDGIKHGHACWYDRRKNALLLKTRAKCGYKTSSQNTMSDDAMKIIEDCQKILAE